MAKKQEPKSTFEKLVGMDVNKYKEKKGKFDYLSWADAWMIFKTEYPNASFIKHKNTEGYPAFFGNDGTAFVSVTVDTGEEGSTPITEDLYVMDNFNNAITNPTSQDVNSSLQRCLTKAMAYHGLGLYIFRGEDFPKEEVADNFSKDKSVIFLSPEGEPRELMAEDKTSLEELCTSSFEIFIPDCKTNEELTKFVKDNQMAVNIIMKSEPHSKRFKEAGEKRKSELEEERRSELEKEND